MELAECIQHVLEGLAVCALELPHGAEHVCAMRTRRQGRDIRARTRNRLVVRGEQQLVSSILSVHE